MEMHIFRGRPTDLDEYWQLFLGSSRMGSCTKARLEFFRRERLRLGDGYYIDLKKGVCARIPRDKYAHVAERYAHREDQSVHYALRPATWHQSSGPLEEEVRQRNAEEQRLALERVHAQQRVAAEARQRAAHEANQRRGASKAAGAL